MKASVVTAYGGPEVTKYQNMPDPKPGMGDVLVRVAGIGISACCKQPSPATQ
jgi:NADPH:quinone reductase-like Zn-dependent oxidoreductase